MYGRTYEVYDPLWIPLVLNIHLTAVLRWNLSEVTRNGSIALSHMEFTQTNLNQNNFLQFLFVAANLWNGSTDFDGTFIGR